MPGVRPCTDEDLERVAALHRRVFVRARPSALRPDGADAYYREALLANPWRDERIAPLVFENGRGRITGFVGVIPRPMAAGDRHIRAAVLSSFMVDPEHGSPVVAAALLKRAVDGGQDLTFGNGANDSMRALWQASGRGVVSHLSMRWWRLVRPVAFVADRLRRRGGPARALGSVLRPASALLDVSAPAGRAAPRASAPRMRSLCVEELVGFLERSGRDRSIRSAYTTDELTWLLGYLGAPGDRSLHATGVEVGGRLVGWFIARRVGSVLQVLQLGAFDGGARDVVAAAVGDAFARGASSIQGRLDALLLAPLWDAGCIVKRGPWFLIDARDRELLAEVHSGRAWITSLETASLPLDW
jgi:hypothetical protein